MSFICDICQYEIFENGGGWNSMHLNYSDFHNINVAINRGEILNYIENMINDMKESKYVNNDFNNINRLTFCIYEKLKQINVQTAEEFLYKYKIRIKKGYKLALSDLENKLRKANYDLNEFQAYYREELNI